MNQLTVLRPTPGRIKVHGPGYRLFTALLCVCGLVTAKTLVAADFTVTTPGFFYAFNSTGQNPTITLVRGKTYTFAVNAGPTHPLLINSAGVLNNNVSQGTISFTVPNVASNYTYICSVHGFGGQILTVAPPPPTPPKIRILSVDLGTNLVLLSTGTNTWSVLPEYSTNIIGTNWFALTVVSNFFSKGTNETFCGLPPSTPAFIRIRSQPQ